MYDSPNSGPCQLGNVWPGQLQAYPSYTHICRCHWGIVPHAWFCLLFKVMNTVLIFITWMLIIQVNFGDNIWKLITMILCKWKNQKRVKSFHSNKYIFKIILEIQKKYCWGISVCVWLTEFGWHSLIHKK